MVIRTVRHKPRHPRRTSPRWIATTLLVAAASLPVGAEEPGSAEEPPTALEPSTAVEPASAEGSASTEERASADELASAEHPLLASRVWLTAGTYVAGRDFDASAGLSIGGDSRSIDFESALGFADTNNLFMAELGWDFAERWGLALQRFSSSQGTSRVIQDNIEWQGNLYEAGVRLDTNTGIDITRVFFARRFRDRGPHHLRVGAGLHWLSVEASLAGIATLGDQSREFRRSVASADLPVPNIGAWYTFSNSKNWLLSARVDWLSAGVDNWSGRIWNVAAGGGRRLTDHLGIGLNYQYFELSGRLKEDNWRGDFEVAFSGPYLYLSGYW
jgi:hypothetical protein